MVTKTQELTVRAYENHLCDEDLQPSYSINGQCVDCGSTLCRIINPSDMKVTLGAGISRHTFDMRHTGTNASVLMDPTGLQESL